VKFSTKFFVAAVVYGVGAMVIHPFRLYFNIFSAISLIFFVTSLFLFVSHLIHRYNYQGINNFVKDPGTSLEELIPATPILAEGRHE
jgi:hypothetical protein